MSEDTFDKAKYMLWSTGPENAYADGTPVPRVTYRCKTQSAHHKCKRVTDHDGVCECICGRRFETKVTN